MKLLAALSLLALTANAQTSQNICTDKFDNIERLVNTDLLDQARNNVRYARDLVDETQTLKDALSRGTSAPKFEDNINRQVESAKESALHAEQALYNNNMLLSKDLDEAYASAKRTICGDDNGCRPGTSDANHLEALNRVRDVAKNALQNGQSATNSAREAQSTLASVKSAVTNAQQQVDRSSGNQDTARMADSVRRHSADLLADLRDFSGDRRDLRDNHDGDRRDRRDRRSSQGSMAWLNSALRDFYNNRCIAQ